MKSCWLMLLIGCGGNAWTDFDTKAAQDAVSAQQTLVVVCEGDAGCTPGIVRAVERATSCNLASMLARHGAGNADAGGCSK